MTLLRRLAFVVASFLGITLVTFALLSLAGRAVGAADEAEPRPDPGARARAARLAERYALDRPLFFNPDPPDARGRWPEGERRRVEQALGRPLPEFVDGLLDSDDFALARGLELLRTQAGFPSFGRPEGAPGRALTPEEERHNDALRRDVALWWRRHHNEYRERSAAWRATIGALTETRYAAWLGDLVRLDLGDSISIRPQARVLDLLRERLPVTLLVMGLATAVLFCVGVPLGLLCAARRGGWFDLVTQGALFVLHATPEFWVATICLVYFASDAHWHLFPVGGLLSPEVADALSDARVSKWSSIVLVDAAHHLVLPVMVLVLPALVVVARHVRASAIEVLGSRFVTALRARGIPRRRIVFVHALRNCAPPAVALFTSVLPGLVTGSILIEVLFSLEGMGLLSWQAATLHDFPVGMAILTLVAVVMLLAHLLTDVLHGLVDPRVRAS